MEQPKNQDLRPIRYDYRLVFEKTGRARYISHLDLMRTMQRSIKRAGLPIWYTQGFNPHAYLMFPLALPLGAESVTEILDAAFLEDIAFEEMLKRLNAASPEGICFLKAYRPKMKHTEIASAEYELTLKASGMEELRERFDEFVNAERVEIKKRLKPKRGREAGFKLMDIKPYVKILEEAQTPDGGLFVRLTLPAGGGLNLNTSVLTDAFFEAIGAEPEAIYVKRTKILCENGEVFT